MIQTEIPASIPDLAWSEYSSREFEMVPKEIREQLVRSSSLVRLFSDEGGPLMVAGLYRPTLLSAAHFWALLTPHFSSIKSGDIRRLVQYLRAIPGLVETFIEVGNERADKLARLFGFQPTQNCGTIGSMQMCLYRRT